MFNTILYIEDDKLAQTLNEIYFKESGFCKNVINLSSGRQALNFFERIVNGEELIENMPEIIFLDINIVKSIFIIPITIIIMAMNGLHIFL